MKPNLQKLTLDQPAVYQIKVPGKLEKNISDWIGEMSLSARNNKLGMPVISLTGTLDQTALIGLLRRLYSLGIPILSVECLKID